ncbi:hypothetical protein ACIBF5_32555, partial [Micromonospora sp. NPDC050417]|uniref:hypothetical protein n=1 Tax=Micromonospora sp. NPDC050417 TaxID=3364280 RepID=UPI00379ED781
MDSRVDLPLVAEQSAVQVEPADQRVTPLYVVDSAGTTADPAVTDPAQIPTPEATSGRSGPVVEEGWTPSSTVLFRTAGVESKRASRVAHLDVDESDEEGAANLPLEGVDLPESLLLTGVGPQSVPDSAAAIRDERELAKTVRRAEGAEAPVDGAEVRADLMPEPPMPPLIVQPVPVTSGGPAAETDATDTTEATESRDGTSMDPPYSMRPLLEDPAPAEQVQSAASQGPAPTRNASEPADPGSVSSSSAAPHPDTTTALGFPTLPEATWSTPNSDRVGVGGSAATTSPTVGGSVADILLPDVHNARALETYPWLALVNPDGAATNCVLVAIAADMSLKPGEALTWTAPAESAMPESDLVTYQRQQLYLSDQDRSPIFRTSIESVRTTMTTAPAGSRGVLLVRDPASGAGVGASHAFNVVVRDGGVVDFLDAQRADWAPEPNESEDLYFLPMDKEIGVPADSYAADPAELDGYAEGVATEVERSAIVMLRPGVDPEYSPVLARRRAGGAGVDMPYSMEVTLDQKTYYQDSDGLFYPDRESARGPGQQEPTGTTFNIIEDRVHPTVADPHGDSGRPSWDSVFREIRGVGERLASAPLYQPGQPGLPIEVLYPPEEGWEIAPDGEGARVFVPFRDDSLYVQWNIGLPIGDGLGMARWLASDPNPPIPEARALLLGGIEFGRDVVAQYLGVSPTEAESYLYMPEVAQLWDFMVHTYTHVSAAAEHDAAKVGMLVKNLLSMGLRNPLAVVRQKLPNSVRLFLEVNAPAIRGMWKTRFHRHITSESIYRHQYLRRHQGQNFDSIDYLQLQTPEAESIDDRYTIGEYLDNALLDNPEFEIEQMVAVGLNSGSGSLPFENLDDNRGRSKESAVYEIRRLRLNRISPDEMNKDHTRIVGLLGGLRAEGERREGEELPQLPLTNQISEFLRTMSGRVASSGPLIDDSHAEEISRQLGAILVGPAYPSWPRPLRQTRQQLGEIGQQLQDYAIMPGADGDFASSRAQELQEILGEIDSLLASSDVVESLTDLYLHDEVDDAAQDPVGQDPVGQDPVGQDPVGQDPVGQDPVGQESVTDWFLSGAGPAGEFTEVIASGLDDVTVHERYPWLGSV